MSQESKDLDNLGKNAPSFWMICEGCSHEPQARALRQSLEESQGQGEGRRLRRDSESPRELGLGALQIGAALPALSRAF